MHEHIGKAFDRLTVLRIITRRYRNRNRSFFECQCLCGNSATILGSHVVNGNTRSCGCRRRVDIAGQRFGRVVVVAFDRMDGQRTLWQCRCDCGNVTVADGSRLKLGEFKSCGCLREEYHNRGNKHDYSSKEYRAWSQMNQRCTNPKNPSFKQYGGRGVVVASQWRGRGGFAKFFAELGKAPSVRHSLDRIDPDRGYEPGNCRWATIKEQNGHLRPRKLIEYNGESLPLMDWARRLDIKYGVLYNRLYVYHLTVCEAFERPGKPFRKTGLKQSKEYGTWARIKYRCSNPNSGAFAFYGGRGIRVCAKWAKSFEAFLSDVGVAPGPEYTLDRIDSNGDYEPGNCRWATRKEQANNTSGTVLLEHDGKTLCLSDWARELGINVTTLRYKLERGTTISDLAQGLSR